MIEIKLNERQLKKLEATLEGTKTKLPREAAIAINATTKKVRSEINKEIRKELATTKKAVDKALKLGDRATPASLQSSVTIKKLRRIPIKDFSARQNRRGVSYRISKTKGRNLAASAFQGPKPGVMKASWKGNAFKRQGKTRLPIVKLFGPSAWGVFVKNGKTSPMQKLAAKELQKQMDRRIRLQLLKKQGAI